MSNVQGKGKLVRGLFWMVALALSVGLQFVIIALAPPGWLTTLISLGPVPTSALDPYNANVQVSLTSSPGLLYASVVPYSYVLRLHDGSVVQKVPERLFAASQGLLFTSVYTPNGNPTVYTNGDTTTVRAFRESDGKLLWSFRLEHGWIAQLSDGKLYLDGAEQGILRAVDPATGHTLWQYQCAVPACEFGMPEVMNGMAYLRVLENGVISVLALSTSTGAVVFHVLGLSSWSLLVAGGQVMAQTADNTITAFSAKDGRQNWQSQVALGAHIPVQSAAANEQVAIFQTPTGVYALRLDTGMRLWQWQGRPVQMRLADTTLYLASSMALVALDAATGQERWQQTYPHADNISQYHSIDDTGLLLGEFNGIVYLHLGVSPAIPKDLLFALRAEDGRQVWQRSVALNLPPVPAGQLESGFSVSFFLVDDRIYVAAYSVVSTEPYPGRLVTSTEPSVHMTISVVPALRAFFNTTTFRLAAQAIDGQTGEVRWQTQQVQTYRVA